MSHAPDVSSALASSRALSAGSDVLFSKVVATWLQHGLSYAFCRTHWVASGGDIVGSACRRQAASATLPDSSTVLSRRSGRIVEMKAEAPATEAK